jgi:flagellar biosynthesis/type III secretory pathway chaperone
MTLPPPRPGSETTTLLQRLLLQAISASERLLEALNRERDALVGRDPVTLEQAVAEKLSAAQEVRQRLSAHEGFLAARRLPPGRSGTERFLAGLPAETEARKLWERLQAVASACRDGNDLNGSLVALGRARTQRAMEILQGGRDPARTYGRLGQTSLGGRSQLLASV